MFARKWQLVFENFKLIHKHSLIFPYSNENILKMSNIVITMIAIEIWFAKFHLNSVHFNSNLSGIHQLPKRAFANFTGMHSPLYKMFCI